MKRNGLSRAELRARNRARQRLCRQRRRSGLTPITIAIPKDLVAEAWRRREHLEGIPDDLLPWATTIADDLTDLITLWTEKWIRARR
jgi:hypothetical protein